MQLVCPRCGMLLPANALACHACGALLYRAQLEQLSSQAMQLEAVDRRAAAGLWWQCLALLPANSQQYQAIHARMNALAFSTMPIAQAPAAPPATDWHAAIAKTVGSMILSIALYSLADGWPFAVGFVLLILVHEMGHTVTNWWFGLRAGPPVFIPFLGAVIVLKDNPPNAKVEAAVGIAGPVAGTLGALVPLGIYLYTGSGLMLLLAYFGFAMNLFNLLPVPPMDGGRATAAVSPVIWILGVAGMIWMIVNDFISNRYGYGQVMLLMLFFGLPRIIATLKNRSARGEYYRLSRLASFGFGALYLGLAGLLLLLTHYTRLRLGPLFQ